MWGLAWGAVCGSVARGVGFRAVSGVCDGSGRRVRTLCLAFEGAKGTRTGPTAACAGIWSGLVVRCEDHVQCHGGDLIKCYCLGLSKDMTHYITIFHLYILYIYIYEPCYLMYLYICIYNLYIYTCIPIYICLILIYL